MTIGAVRELVMRLSVPTGALAALGVALEERVAGVALDPSIKTEIEHLLAALRPRHLAPRSHAWHSGAA